MGNTKLRHVFRAPAELDASTRARMVELMRLCYDNVDDARFESDLAEKQQVICLVDASGALQGFSTVRLAEERLDGRRVDVMFSGDTVVHPDWWGSKSLQNAFLAFTIRHKLKHPWRPLYWMLVSMSYKTYLLMARNFPTAFPAVAASPSASLIALRDRVARAWWGEDYDPRSEILRFAIARDRVKSFAAAPDAQALAQPDVAFFLEKNPRWAEGDELVCLAEVDFALAVRWISKQVRRYRSTSLTNSSNLPRPPRGISSQ